MGKSLVCRIELNKEKGILVTVENEQGKITQTIVMDGTSITTKVKGNSETSTIIQKEDSIEIKCKTFKLEAETITCKSTKATKHESQDIFKVKSTKDLTLDTQAKLNQKAMKDVSMASTSGKIKLTASASDIVAKGLNVKIEGTAKTDIKGGQLAMAGTIKAELKAPMVDIKADGILNAKGGGMATFEGSGMANLKGGLVKIG